MAKRAKFGALPRAVPSLQATILAEARAQQQAIQQDMFDAWQHGGLGPDGTPVTDEDLLKYIKGRRDQLSKGDPEWTMWDNAHTQYTFSIQESKHNLAYQQGHLSAQGFANWYKSQLGSLDKNTEWYRTVAGKAAGWAKSAIAQARAGAKERANAQLSKDLKAANIPVENLNADTNSLARIAVSMGMIENGQTIAEIPSSRVEEFWSAVASAKPIGAGGKVITQQGYSASITAATTGANHSIKLLDQAGFSTKQAKAARDDITQLGSAVGSDRWEVTYTKLNQAWQADVKDAQGNPELIGAINAKYARNLAGLREHVIADKNPNLELAGGLDNEIIAITTGKASGPTVTDMFDNHFAGTANGTSDADSTAAAAVELGNDYQLIATGQGFYGQDKPGAPLAVHPFVIDPRTGGVAQKPNQQVSVINVDGTAQTVVMEGAPITGVEYTKHDPKNRGVHTPLDPSTLTPEEIAAGLKDGSITQKPASDPVGYYYQTGTVKQWGVVQPNGTIIVTDTNPFPPTGPGGGVALRPDGTIVGGSFAPGTTIPVETDRSGAQVATGTDTIIDKTLSPSALVAYGQANPLTPTGQAATVAGNIGLHTRHLENEAGYNQPKGPDYVVPPVGLPTNQQPKAAPPVGGRFGQPGPAQPAAQPAPAAPAAPAFQPGPRVAAGPHLAPTMPAIRLPTVPMGPTPGGERPMTTGPGQPVSLPQIPQFVPDALRPNYGGSGSRGK